MCLMGDEVRRDMPDVKGQAGAETVE